MRPSSQLLHSTPLIQTLREILRDLRHEIEFTSTHPEIALDGLSFVLDAADSRLIPTLYRSGRDADAESLARVMTSAKELGSAEAVAALRAEVCRLLICLPLDSTPVPKRQRMSKEEAKPKIRAYLNKHPNATRDEVAKAVGCSRGTVSSSQPWRAKAKERNAKRTSKSQKIGLDIALNEKAQQVQDQNDLAALIEEHERDKRGEDMKEIRG